MADFINFEAEADFINPEDAKQNGKKDDDEVSDISDVDSENSFIDNEEVQTDVNFCRHFANVENDIEQVLKDAHNEALEVLIGLIKFQIYVMGLRMKQKLTILKILK